MKEFGPVGGGTRRKLLYVNPPLVKVTDPLTGLYMMYEVTDYLKYYSFGSRNLKENHREPISRTWYETRQLCEERAEHLLSFVSHREQRFLIKMILRSSLITHIFIGIYREVSY